MENAECFFFRQHDKQLFGCFHAVAIEPKRDDGILLCYPMGEEYIRFHRAYRQIALKLSEAGVPVLRFDFTGCGDSDGVLDQVTIDQWLSDIDAGVEELKRRAGVSRVSTIGLRIGATLCAIHAETRREVDRMILWDPVIAGADYLEEIETWHGDLLRLSHVQPSGTIGRRPNEYLGFEICDEMHSWIAELDLLMLRRRPAKELLLVESCETPRAATFIERLNALGSQVTQQHIPYPQIWDRSDRFWLEDIFRAEVPHEVVQSIVNWGAGVES